MTAKIEDVIAHCEEVGEEVEGMLHDVVAGDDDDGEVADAAVQTHQDQTPSRSSSRFFGHIFTIVYAAIMILIFFSGELLGKFVIRISAANGLSDRLDFAALIANATTPAEIGGERPLFQHVQK